MSIHFYDVEQRRTIEVPVEQIRKALYKRTARNGKVRVHYALVARLNGTTLTKLVAREDWLALDIPQI